MGGEERGVDATRVLLVDDHPALRVGLRVLLDRETDIVVVGETAEGREVQRLSEELNPDVIVLDCQLPGVDGATVAAQLRAQGSHAHIVALSAYDDDRYIASMLKAGAVGYLLKSEAPGQIVEAVRRVVGGEALWTREQLARSARWQEQVAAVSDALTEREREVLALVAAGLSNKEIAHKLLVTARTVDFHVSNILRKLDVVSRVEAAIWAQVHLPRADDDRLDRPRSPLVTW
jgi:DNA-binding NarL/FixJ family response regulator